VLAAGPPRDLYPDTRAMTAPDAVHKTPVARRLPIRGGSLPARHSRRGSAAGGGEAVEPGGQVGDQVLGILQPDLEADQRAGKGAAGGGAVALRIDR